MTQNDLSKDVTSLRNYLSDIYFNQHPFPQYHSYCAPINEALVAFAAGLTLDESNNFLFVLSVDFFNVKWQIILRRNAVSDQLFFMDMVTSEMAKYLAT